jgi:hypothetical protein
MHPERHRDFVDLLCCWHLDEWIFYSLNVRLSPAIRKSWKRHRHRFAAAAHKKARKLILCLHNAASECVALGVIAEPVRGTEVLPALGESAPG